MDTALLDLLTQQIDFQLRSDTGVDDRGNQTGEWVTDLSNIPCRVEWLGGSENRVGREVTDKSHRIFVNGDVAVTEAHRAVMGDRVFEINWVGIRYDEDGNEHHRTIRCEEVR